MNKTIFILMLVILAFIPILASAKTVETSLYAAGLEITYPTNNFYAKGTNITLNFHVYNSTGYPRTNQTCTCNFHLYNNYGDHIIDNKMTTFEHDRDFEQKIYANITNAIGDYSYLIDCNDTERNQAGFLKSEFNINTDGLDREYTNAGSPIAVTIFIIIIPLIVFFLPFMFKRFTKDELLNLIITRACFLIALALMTFNSGMMATIADYGQLGLTEELFTYLFIIGWAMYLAMFYLVIKTLFDTLKLWKIKKQKKRDETENDD